MVIKGTWSNSDGKRKAEQPAYRDRAKERRELCGEDGPPRFSAVKARDINGNLDWRCGHCNKLNFARTIYCTSCMREVDETTEYIESSESQAKRIQGMKTLSRSLAPDGL